ncbi:MAG: hypothetical protein ACFCAD_25220 [Pleurocapsa sp.]
MLKIRFGFRKTKAALAIFIPLAVCLTSCDNEDLFKQLQRFSSSAQQLQNKFPDIATDVYDSCLRTARYTPIQASNKPFRDRQNSQASCTKLKFSNEAEEISSSRKEFEEQLITVNEVIVNYLLSLSDVAGGEEIVYMQNLEALGDAVNRVEPRLKMREVKAGQDIINFLANAMSREFRRETLAIEIPSTNKPLQVYICRLKKDIVGQYLNAELQTEKKAIDEYYQAYINREIRNDRVKQEREYLIQQYLRQELQLKPTDNTPPTKPPLTVMKLESQWQEAIAKVRQREMMAQAYIDVLNTIAKGHSDLSQQLGGAAKGQREFCPNQPNELQVLDEFDEILAQEIKESDPVASLTQYTNRIELMLAQLNSISPNN